jgi:predicted O-linked N-acetylglucosamine transferase (SPINDLY family)
MTIAYPASASAARCPTELLDEARRVLAAYTENPGDAAVWQDVCAARRAAAAAFAALVPAQKTGAEIEAADELLQLFSKSGASDHAPTSDDLALAREYAGKTPGKSWPGLLAAMLLTPAWEWPECPRYDDVPPWMWPAFTVYVFHTPQAFSALGQAERYAAHYLRRLEELARAGAIARGSAAVKTSIEVCVRRSNCIPLYFSAGSLKRHYELRAKLFALAFNVPAQADLPPLPRDGRRLRVGFVNRHFGQQTETYTTLPMFEQLDPSRFEVLLFAHHAANGAVEDYCRQRAAEFHQLPGDLAAQLDTIRAAYPDVLVFGTNLTAVPNEVARLALHRLAPLQVVNNSSCVTSGFPEIDLYLSGSLTEAPDAPAHFTERLGLIPGPTHAFQYDVDRAEPTTPWTREQLGLPADATVFVTAANFFKIIPEMQHAWARLLAAVPGSRLLVHPFNPNWSSKYPIARFCAEFDRVLAAHGVAGERLLVSTEKFSSRADVKELLSVGDIYLDSFPFGGVNSLIDPLELGLPVIAWEGDTFRARMGGALLRSLGLDELVATNEQHYRELAAALATDTVRRAALATRIRAAMERLPVFLDSLAHSDAVGELLEAAYDQLFLLGRDAFRRERAPLVAAEVIPAVMDASPLADARLNLRARPADPAARREFAQALLAVDQPARAVQYFLAAVQQDERNGALWFELSQALRRAGQTPQALEALEACLRVDEQNVDAWLTFAECARECGQLDLAREAATMAQKISPDDARLPAYLT